MEEPKNVTLTRELKPLLIFEKLDVDEIREINALTTTVEHPAGHRLFSQGDPGDCLYVLVRGRIRIEIDQSGKSEPVASLEEGAVIGEIGMFITDKRTASAIVDTDAKLLLLQRETFLAELRKGSIACYKVMLNIARDMARKLRETNKHLGKLQAKPATGELASLRNDLLKDWTF